MIEIIEMAKAHLQNVASRIEELRNQEKLVHDEIEKLSAYFKAGLESIEKHLASTNVETNS